jgi:hypothetical protein
MFLFSGLVQVVAASTMIGWKKFRVPVPFTAFGAYVGFTVLEAAVTAPTWAARLGVVFFALIIVTGVAGCAACLLQEFGLKSFRREGVARPCWGKRDGAIFLCFMLLLFVQFVDWIFLFV